MIRTGEKLGRLDLEGCVIFLMKEENPRLHVALWAVAKHSAATRGPVNMLSYVHAKPAKYGDAFRHFSCVCPGRRSNPQSQLSTVSRCRYKPRGVFIKKKEGKITPREEIVVVSLKLVRTPCFQVPIQRIQLVLMRTNGTVSPVAVSR